ncbi:MAG: LuxR family transcriptional regulator, partial [Armatimonadetes bacterium]|nr:LuxR family transcriptional regulator [Armatimonadota bacterium]
MPKGQSRLTVRERQVLANVAVLGDAAHAAATLGLSRRTVERHLAEV